jgi:hypothetical protein
MRTGFPVLPGLMNEISRFSISYTIFLVIRHFIIHVCLNPEKS